MRDARQSVTLEVFRWKPGAGYDLHLVPGLVSPRLGQQLELWVDGTPWPGDLPPGGVTVTWETTAPTGDPASDGVDVDLGDARVTVSDELPSSRRLLDFLMIATATDGIDSLQAYVRVAIHREVLRAWLT